MKKTDLRRYSKQPLRRERGIVLFIALVVLVAMTLAGLAMFRQVGTGLTIAGNLAFKENATSVGDLGFESARTWLQAQSPLALQADDVPDGYCSNWQTDLSPVIATRFDPTTYDWLGSGGCANNSGSKQVTPDDGIGDGTGNEVRYVIHRMCSKAGATNDATPPAQQCATVTAAGAGGSQAGAAYGAQALTNTVQPYFRITVRVKGPRNTYSYIQTIMY